MNTYELTLVLPEKGKTKEKAFSERIEKLVGVLNGKVVKKETWGEIELAYPIKKQTVGFFMHFVIELDKSGPKELTNKLRVEDDLIRYLLVRSS
jgi:small subunit ribosomal protein S6